ncbi:MAG: hypothetical protein M0T74_18020 [Desulfitobacterium hafniense]|nr:hypothetical protein [Desulfitobacterium hafniense]
MKTSALGILTLQEGRENLERLPKEEGKLLTSPGRGFIMGIRV